MIKIRFSFCKEMIRRTIDTGEQQLIMADIRKPDGTIQIACTFHSEKMAVAFLITDTDGTQRKRSVNVIEENSNLGNGSKVYYFHCYGYKCRTLYTDGKVLLPRRTFRHFYRRQNLGQTERIISPKKEPYRKYGKVQYRGKETPYGRRLRKHEAYESRRERAWLGLCGKLLGRWQGC